MKHIAACCVLCCLLIVSMPDGLHAEVIDKIIAIFDQELILLSEIREQIARPATLIVANVPNSSQPEHDALPYILERRLLKREIQYLASPKEPTRMQELALTYLAIKYQHGTADDLRKKLEHAGISSASVEEELLLYMKGMDYIRRKHRFNDDIESPQVVIELFNTWMNELNAGTKFQIIP